MSMVLVLESVSSEELAPDVERATIPFEPRASWDAGMLVGGESDENSISLEKAWHGLHFLLNGDPWGGSGHRAFLLMGGTEQGEDMGYGPARVFGAKEVAEIAKTFEAISSDDLWSRFDASAMARADVYPGIWDEEEDELREEYCDYFEMLKEFLARTAGEGNSLRVMMC